MDDKSLYCLTVLAVVGVASYLLRALPFLLFARRGEPPKVVKYVGRVLSPAAIAMLVVYCYAGYAGTRPPAEHLWGAAELAAGAATLALHFKWRNPLVSIAAGTFVYMALVRWF